MRTLQLKRTKSWSDGLVHGSCLNRLRHQKHTHVVLLVVLTFFLRLQTKVMRPNTCEQLPQHSFMTQPGRLCGRNRFRVGCIACWRDLVVCDRLFLALMSIPYWDFFQIVQQVLGTYNPSSAYVKIAQWNGFNCSHCGYSADLDDAENRKGSRSLRTFPSGSSRRIAATCRPVV